QNQQKTKGKIELFNTKAGVLQILCVILHLLVDSLGSSSGKHDYKSCLPSEVKDIKNTALTQFDLHYHPARHHN
ncbi:MAG: hypothetical protein ACFN4W_09785, partial [Segatella oris]